MVELKQRSARELHDGVLQDLAIAKLASELGDLGAVDEAIDRSLHATRHIISQLLPEAPDPGDFRRTEAIASAAPPDLKTQAAGLS